MDSSSATEKSDYYLKMNEKQHRWLKFFSTSLAWRPLVSEWEQFLINFDVLALIFLKIDHKILLLRNKFLELELF